MAIEVKHKFKSEMADGPNEELVQPSHWNDTHEIEVSGKVLSVAPTLGTAPLPPYLYRNMMKPLKKGR